MKKRTSIIALSLFFIAGLYPSEVKETAATPEEATLLASIDRGDEVAASKLYLIAQKNLEKNPRHAIRLLRKLTNPKVEGVTRAMSLATLAQLYERGSSVPHDFKRAVELYQRALAIKESHKITRAFSYLGLGAMYRVGGFGIKQDLETAKNYLLQVPILMQGKSEDEKNKNAASLHELGVIAVLQNNIPEAKFFFLTTVGQHVSPYSMWAAQSLGDILKNEGELQKAVKYYKIAADQTDEPISRQTASKELAFLLFKGGPGLERDVPGAQKYALQVLRETVNPQLAEGMRALLRLSGYKGKLVQAVPKSKEQPKP